MLVDDQARDELSLVSDPGLQQDFAAMAEQIGATTDNFISDIKALAVEVVKLRGGRKITVGRSGAHITIATVEDKKPAPSRNETQARKKSAAKRRSGAIGSKSKPA